MSKPTKPVVNLPSQYRIMSMLNPNKKGKIDRSFIKLMCSAIETERHFRNKSLRQGNRDSQIEE